MFVRVTNLTDLPYEKLEHSRSGPLYLKGVTERQVLEIIGSKPLRHRRLVLRCSKATFSGLGLMSGLPDESGSLVFGRRPGVYVSGDEGNGVELQSLFKTTTMDGLLEGPVNDVYVTKVEDRTRTYSGSTSGRVSAHKFWNSLGIKVDTMPVKGSLVPLPGFSHVVLVDVFAYGFPSVGEAFQEALRRGKGRRGDDDEDASMLEGVKMSSIPFSGSAVAALPTSDDDDAAVVRSELYLYWVK